MMKKRTLVLALFFAAACTKQNTESDTTRVASIAATPVATAPATAPASAPATARTIKVYKDPNCGCCKEWIRHLEQN